MGGTMTPKMSQQNFIKINLSEFKNLQKASKDFIETQKRIRERQYREEMERRQREEMGRRNT